MSIHMCVHIYIYTHLYTYRHAHNTCMHVYIYVCMYVLYVCMYTHALLRHAVISVKLLKLALLEVYFGHVNLVYTSQVRCAAARMMPLGSAFGWGGRDAYVLLLRSFKPLLVAGFKELWGASAMCTRWIPMEQKDKGTILTILFGQDSRSLCTSDLPAFVP